MPSDDEKGLYDTWEKAATAWFDAWMRSPAYIGAMGRLLSAQLGLKAAGNRWVDDALELWRIPSGRDIEGIVDRVAALEERLADFEGRTASEAEGGRA